MKDNKIYNAALYCRLSLDDGSVGESESIQTQKIILEEYATIENYKLLKEKVNEFLKFKELNSLIVHSLISRIEVGYRDNPRTIKIYYKYIDTTL